MMRSRNPVLSNNNFSQVYSVSSEDSMTIQGTVNKTAIALLLTLASAWYVWARFFEGSSVNGYMFGGALLGFLVALVTVFKKNLAPITTPAYALLEGLFLGGVSATFERSYPGIVMNAVMLTFGVFFALLFIYKSRMIRVTDNMRLAIAAATGGIALVYFVGFILSFFGKSIPLIHQSGAIGIGFSLLVVGVAAFNLVLDFDFIEQAANNNSPKYMEWFGAFGIIVTLVWLYLEMLRLLSKLQNRR